MTVEMSERAQFLLDELMNVGIIRDMVFGHVKDRKQLKELAALKQDLHAFGRQVVVVDRQRREICRIEENVRSRE